ncbi:YjjI family glycine radical enzyme [Peptoniphilus sp. KCTC 25270]|uniref:YjjI family glycine radical enzyme n=1 Tax=Peptoniphilus sp. KCTC 25270 TaxID=2897414 RepID=UPI001E3F76B3|nr:YjjI family glycine radical enzyme [Peptoniphilus sp. KCTC 25270]MCD1147936.1 YjjI family glycine radical enzyme [Peptoniphilus sp. KCTC 25270]
MDRFYTIEDVQKEVAQLINDTSQTYGQQTSRLAKIAENSMPYPVAKDHDFYNLYDSGQICDLDEGHAPYAPRYILPDYEKYLKEGSKFLRMEPAENLMDATTNLLILYHHVPSVTRFPVYIGSLDTLLEPFVEKEEPEMARHILRNFLLQLDRTVDDSFCHANIGPKATKTGELILELVSELQNATPNLTLLYHPEITPDDFAEKAVSASLTCANPAFANHKMYSEDFGETPYGIASCYNALPIHGGAFTLSRLRLNKVAEGAETEEDFFQNVLPKAVHTLTDFMEHKIDFLVKETSFFKSSFLVEEDLVSLENFVGLFGIVGLHECVQTLLGYNQSKAVFGRDEEANAMGQKVMDAVQELVGEHTSKYSPVWGHKFMLHAQVGAAGDTGTTAAHRIQIGSEPDLYTHLRQTASFQPYFPSGVGDHFPFDETAKRNPKAVVDIFKGAFQLNNRYLSSYNDDGDLIRVTGYLVKKSDVEAFGRGEQVSYDTVQYALDPLTKYGILERKVEEV